MSTCRTCKHKRPTTVYPLLLCGFNDTYTKPSETCVRWESASVQAVATAFGIPESSLEEIPTSGGGE